MILLRRKLYSGQLIKGVNTRPQTASLMDNDADYSSVLKQKETDAGTDPGKDFLSQADSELRKL